MWCWVMKPDKWPSNNCMCCMLEQCKTSWKWNIPTLDWVFTSAGWLISLQNTHIMVSNRLLLPSNQVKLSSHVRLSIMSRIRCAGTIFQKGGQGQKSPVRHKWGINFWPPSQILGVSWPPDPDFPHPCPELHSVYLLKKTDNEPLWLSQWWK